MIDINNLNLSNTNKNILSKYQTYLITVKFLNVETTIASYILDIYKYLEYTNKDYNKTDNKDIYNYLLEENIYVINLDIERPKFYKKLPHVLSIDEVDKLLDIKLETAFDYRN